MRSVGFNSAYRTNTNLWLVYAATSVELLGDLDVELDLDVEPLMLHTLCARGFALRTVCAAATAAQHLQTSFTPRA